MLNPLGIVNDGYLELCYAPKVLGMTRLLQIFLQAKTGGTHVYDNSLQVYRAKKLKIVNKSGLPQPVDIDGEPLEFTKFLKYEVLKQKISFIVDAKALFLK